MEKKKYGGVRVCHWCFKAKPDRSHHCSQCNRCVLKMDHHCPWVANCIGFYNYKFFICVLFNCALTCWMIVCTSYPVIVMACRHPEYFDFAVAYYVVTSYVLAAVMAVLITGFFSFHCYLIWCQYTTIEFCEKRRADSDSFHSKYPYNLGLCANFRLILGDNPLLWFIPIFPNLEGGGLVFRLSPDFEEKIWRH